MISYKGDFFFLLPKGLASYDIKFDIYDLNGNYVGNNFTGIKQCTYYSKEEKYELEEIVQNRSMDFEVRMKFLKEFGTSIKNWKKLKKPREVILSRMTNAWNVPKDVIINYLI